MKVLVLAPEERYKKFMPDTPVSRKAELIFCDRSGTEEDWLVAGADAEVLFVTPVTQITARLIAGMPKLRMIHCEGVGVDRIDLEAARARGIYVCNNAGCNAAAVAELSITLMSMLTHRTLWGDHMVRTGHQLDAQRELDCQIPLDLSAAKVGLIGFGAIGQAAAQRLRAYGSTLYYYARHRRDRETEENFGVAYLPLYELAETCDIISLYLPATAESRHMLNGEFFSHVKPGTYLVNTARGAVIDDEALGEAIRSGRLAGAAVDAYDPEPVEADHPLVRLAEEFPDRLVLCPHQGGIARSAYQNVYRMLFENLERLMEGKRPERIVNGL